LNLTKKTLFIIIGVVGLYATFLIFSDVSLLLEKFKDFDSTNLLFIVPLVIFSYFIRGLRWNMLLRSLQIDIGVKESLQVFFAGMAFGITPAKIGEVIKSHLLKKDHSQPISKTAPVIFIERYYDLVGIIVILSAGMWFIDLQKILIVTLFGVAISLMILSQQRDLFESILKKMVRIPILKKYATNILLSYDTVSSLLKPKIYAKAIAYSIAAWGVESLAVFFIFEGFQVDLGFPVTALIFTSSTLLGGVSLVPGGVGITEGGMLGLLLFYKIDYTTSFSLVLLVRLLTLWMSIVIGFIVLKFKI
jgi:uncharacterized protein (TIRG00374 family)